MSKNDPATSLIESPMIWRTKLRSTVKGIDWDYQVDHCLKKKLVGIGWRIDELQKGSSLDAVCEFIERNPDDGWGKRAAQTVRRFGEQAQIGEFVWTRDTKGRYLLCKITGEYRYANTAESKKADVHQVRAVEWARDPLNDLDVPGGVIRAFAGTGSSFSRIHDASARKLTPYLWEKLNGRRLPKLDVTPNEVLRNLLDPYDVEDLVYVWLQVERDFLAMPRSRQRDTPAYEWTMVNRKSRRRGIVQVKAGADQVDLQALADARTDRKTETFAFATSGRYVGKKGVVTEVIDADELLAFAKTNPDLLSGRVRTWFELAK